MTKWAFVKHIFDKKNFIWYIINMNQGIPIDIHETVINTIESDYVKIFWLSPESTAILHRNLTNMTDEELSKEMELIGIFHDSSEHAYQNGVITTIHLREEEEQWSIHTILNY